MSSTEEGATCIESIQSSAVLEYLATERLVLEMNLLPCGLSFISFWISEITHRIDTQNVSRSG